MSSASGSDVAANALGGMQRARPSSVAHSFIESAVQRSKFVLLYSIVVKKKRPTIERKFAYFPTPINFTISNSNRTVQNQNVKCMGFLQRNINCE